MLDKKAPKRRLYSADFKRTVVSASYRAGQSVSRIARQYDVNANLVFRWRRDRRFNDVLPATPFLPVTVAPPDVAPPTGDSASAARGGQADRSTPLLSGDGLDIHLPCGTWLRCGGELNAALLTAALTALGRSA